MNLRPFHAMRSLLLALALAPAAGAPPARALDPSADDPGILGLVDDWYAEQCAGAEGRPYRLMAPGGIDASPGYVYPDTGSAAAVPPIYVSLAATAPLFRYEIAQIRADPRFAKVRVRERGYRQASASAKTYELMSDAVLVAERQDDGRWLVLAYRTTSTGFHSSLATDPMPDLGPGRERPRRRCARFDPTEYRR
ncbi:MAG: hypothetical protein ACT6RD_11875 [Brevundimonas sp.]|uniref:hypothetical protein n=1 Tax=Brevundimonas sp. TaxID=1871086 RepID=UPI0040346095